MGLKNKRRFVDPFLAIDESDDVNINEGSSESEREDERRLKAAKSYLKKQKRDKVSLEKVVAKTRFAKIAAGFSESNVGAKIAKLTKHSQTVTSITVSADDKYVYTGAKDGSIAKWNVEKGARELVRRKPRKSKEFEGHYKAVLAVAVSPDGKILVSGGIEKLIFVWETGSLTVMHRLKGHLGAVTSLLFTTDPLRLYSSSADHTVRSWNMASMLYIETLFGHHCAVNSLHALGGRKVLACSSDRTARLFKINEGTQLIFDATEVHFDPLDCCALLTSQEFVVGSQDGSLSLWSSASKSPLCVVPKAHEGRWICSIAAFPNSDLFATGSSDGFLRVWKREDSEYKKKSESRRISQINKLKVEGFINAIRFGSSADKIFVAVGREHRLGRWEVLAEALNCAYCIFVLIISQLFAFAFAVERLFIPNSNSTRECEDTPLNTRCLIHCSEGFRHVGEESILLNCRGKWVDVDCPGNVGSQFYETKDWVGIN